MKPNLFIFFSALTITALFGFVQISFALETVFPPLFGITLTNESSPTQFVLYFFMVLVALGAVIAFVVLVMAGFKIMMAGGQPSQISSAKNQIMGAFIGLIVLFCSYMILSIINTNLTQVKITSFDCSEVPICVEYTKIDPDTKEPKVTTEMSIPLSNDNLELKQGEKIVIKRYTGLWELWTFPEPNFKSPVKLQPAYRDSSQDIDPDKPTVATDLVLEPKVKSYKLIPKVEGIYLYDRKNYQIGDGAIAPFFLNKSVPDFSQTAPDFFQKAQSFQGIFATGGTDTPSGVFFSEPNYRGFCAPLFRRGSKGGTVYPFRAITSFVGGVPFIKVGSSEVFGNNVASALYFKFSLGGKGSVTFYDGAKCEGNSKTKEFINTNVLAAPVSNALPGFEQIKSFKINGPVGVLLVNGTRCQYFTEKDFTDGDCVSSLEGSDVVNPSYLMLLPTNQ